MGGTGQATESTWWRGLAGGLRGRRERRAAAHTLYTALVAQARDPFLFAALGVPDTREGRLEAVLLHAMLTMRRLQAEGEPGKALAQALFDLMFADIDQHMREWGVGDLSVGKHVKRVAQTFYARIAAAEPALAARDADALVPALARNVYGADDPAAAAQARRLAAYLLVQAAWLDGHAAGILDGEVEFLPAAQAVAAGEAQDARVATSAD